MIAYEDDCITFLNTPIDTPLYAESDYGLVLCLLPIILNQWK